MPTKSDEVLNADLVNQKTNSNANDASKIDEKAISSSVEEVNIVDIVSVEDVKGDEHEDLDKNHSESNLDSSFVLDPSKTDSYIADNTVKEFVSENSDRILDADLVNKRENDLNEKMNQDNYTDLTSALKLESDSLEKCTLDSCTVEKNREKSFVTKELSDNIASPVNEENSYQQKNDHSPITKQDGSEKKQVNSELLKNPSTADLENENNDTNNIHPQKNELGTSQQLPSVNQADSSTQDLLTNTESQNTSMDELQDSINDSEKLNSNDQEKNKVLTTSYQQSSLKITEISINQKISNNNPQNSFPNSIQNDNGSNKLNLEDSSYKKQNIKLSENELPSSIEITDKNSYVGNLHDSKNNYVDEFNKPQQQGSGNSDSLPKKANVSVHQSPPLALLEKVKDKLNNENDSLPSNLIENSLLNDYSQSKINEFSKQSDSKNNIGTDSYKALNDQSKFENQNISNEKQHNVESTTPNNNSVDNNSSSYSSPLQELTNDTSVVSSPDSQNPAGTEQNMIEKSIEPCISGSENCVPKDNDPNSDERIQQKYIPENKELPYYNNAHKYTKNDNDVKYKEFEPKSFVSSFGHPDTCSGIGCLNFNRNIEKTIKSPQTLNSISKQENPDAGSINTNFEKENKNVIHESSEKSDMTPSFLDSFLHWVSSPTLNTIDLLKNAIGEHSNENNGEN